jgi:hypothetical protein
MVAAGAGSHCVSCVGPFLHEHPLSALAAMMKHYQNSLTPSEQRTELSDVELLRRAVSYSRPCGFGVISKWRAVGIMFGVDEVSCGALVQTVRSRPQRTRLAMTVTSKQTLQHARDLRGLPFAAARRWDAVLIQPCRNGAERSCAAVARRLDHGRNVASAIPSVSITGQSIRVV